MKFNIDDYVRVKPGVRLEETGELVPGWVGRIDEVPIDPKDPIYLIELDPVSLDNLPEKYLRLCIEDEEPPIAYYFPENELEPAVRLEAAGRFMKDGLTRSQPISRFHTRRSDGSRQEDRHDGNASVRVTKGVPMKSGANNESGAHARPRFVIGVSLHKPSCGFEPQDGLTFWNLARTLSIKNLKIYNL